MDHAKTFVLILGIFCNRNLPNFVAPSWHGDGALVMLLVHSPLSFAAILPLRTTCVRIWQRCIAMHAPPRPWRFAARAFDGATSAFELLCHVRNCDMVRATAQMHRATRALRVVWVMAQTETQHDNLLEFEYVAGELRMYIARMIAHVDRNAWTEAQDAIRALVAGARSFSMACAAPHPNCIPLRFDPSSFTISVLQPYTPNFIHAFQGFSVEIFALGALMGGLPPVMGGLPHLTHALLPPWPSSEIAHLADMTHGAH